MRATLRMLRRFLPIAVLVALALIQCTTCQHAQQQQQLHTVQGFLTFPVGTTLSLETAPKVLITLESGRQLQAYPRSDLSFEVQGVPPGAHALDAFVPGFMFPSLCVDVAATGDVTAAYAEEPTFAVPHPFKLRAVPVDYFDKVAPFNLLAFLKSPMGMMAGFMIFALVVMPKLKVDPEEYQQAMAELKGEKPAASASESKRIATGASGAAPKALGNGQQQQRSRKKQ